MRAFKAMLKIESKLSLRGMDMFIFAICMPVLIMIIFGMIYDSELAFDGATYTFLEQSFPAIATIAICAGGVMGLPLVIADYRGRKILKRLKVTPTSPTLILAVHVMIYALYSIVSLFLVYVTGALLFNFQFHGSWSYFLGSYLLVMLAIFSIGLVVGGLAANLKIASALASLLYFPMLIFSGATLPYEAMPATLQAIADVLPLTQGIKLLKVTSLGLPIDDTFVPIVILVGVAIVCISITVCFFKWE